MDELVAVARDGADERRLARVVPERAPQAPHGLGERAVGDHDVAPRRVHDVAAGHRLVPAPDQQHQQVEVARDQGDFDAAAEDDPPAGRHREVPEAEDGVGGGIAGGRQGASIIAFPGRRI